MLLRMIYDDYLAQAAWLVGCPATGQALVIDPERDVDRYIDLAARHGLTITAVAETHIHADFLYGGRQLAEQVGATLYVSDEGGPDWLYNWLDAKRGGGSYDAVRLRDGDTFTVGNIEFQAMHTPGHTPEHMCYLVTDRGSGATDPIGIATGDFVFVGDLGRPDLLESAAGQVGVKEGFARMLCKSTEKFVKLPEFVQVWPAHGAGSACGKALGAVPSSTVGYEKRYNASLAHAGNEEDFVNFILAGQPAPPLYFARMKHDNRDGVKLLDSLPCPEHYTAEKLSHLESGTVVLDTRPWADFRDGHLPGSLWAPPSVQYAMVAGSYIEPDEPIVLIAEPSKVDVLTRVLVRIGLDKVVGYATPEDIAALDSASLDRVPEISAEAFLKGELDDACVLDVRGEHEHAAGALEGAVNIAHTRLKEHIGSLPKDKPIVAHCKSGTRSAAAVAFLRRQGHQVTNLAGGYEALQAAGAEIVKKQPQQVS